MKFALSKTVSTKLPPAVAGVVFRSLRSTSLGIVIPADALPRFAAAASDTSISKLADSLAPASFGLAR